MPKRRSACARRYRIDPQDTSARRGALVLAGGRSTRFGERDKVLAALAGVPMVRRVAERLAGLDELVVSCRADQTTAIERALSGMEFHCVADPDPDCGPLVGVRTGLRALDTDYAAVVAADMPFVDPEFVSSLFTRAAGHDAAVPRHEGWLQPTQAIYRTDATADACAAALSRGERELRAALDALDHVVVTESEIREHADPRTFTNLNTRREFAAAERVLGTGDCS
ncbi:molybdopterin-guanine dinucleotide biosynthesis protein A [Halococcus morrhuae DSM 1307]|uniref:Probable molybdenum cofactor guanylyltransferase n=1 Tax=Halococcus morrhuae DSM 1307 TaxID=931277 RepID=M0MAL5_HALMO|nr:molybdopterin-guanine dinucleotide biosynthesis protein A [Halococcus morrhuae DSM 1307]